MKSGGSIIAQRLLYMKGSVHISVLATAALLDQLVPLK